MTLRIRTPSQIIGYRLHLYFIGLSFRNAAKALPFFFTNSQEKSSCFDLEMDTKIQSLKYILQGKEVSEYSCIQKDETIIKIGSELILL